jgi:hypothetical protein
MSNISRPFNVIRRRANLADILIPKSLTTEKYRLLAAPNFDGSFVQIIEANISSGYLDPALVISNRVATLHSVNNPGQIRVTFDPETFAVLASIADADIIWLKFQAVDFAGLAGTASNPIMILPEVKLRGDSSITIAGLAPNAADVAGSLQLDLGYRMQDIAIRNEEGATPLYVATEAGGAEVKVDGGSLTLSQYTLAFGAQGTIFVRGGGGTARFSATMTSFLPL